MRLGYESKAKFQAAYFGKLAEKLLEGGNINSNVNTQLRDIVTGLSLAWDNAEEQTGN